MIRRGKRGLEGSIVPFRLRDGQITHCSVVPGTAPFAAGRRRRARVRYCTSRRRARPLVTEGSLRAALAGSRGRSRLVTPSGGRRWRSLREGPLAGGERPDCPFRRRPGAAAMAGYPARSSCGATQCEPARAVLVVSSRAGAGGAGRLLPGHAPADGGRLTQRCQGDAADWSIGSRSAPTRRRGQWPEASDPWSRTARCSRLRAAKGRVIVFQTTEPGG
jgi:hypothetical protein